MHRTALIATVNACMFVFGLVLLLMGSILPTLQVSNLRAGSLGSFPLIGILAATILIGPILDKAGAKPCLAAGLALIVAAMAVMPSLATYAALAAAALIYGLGGGVLNTVTNALVSDLSASGRGAALNLLGFSFSLGAIAAPSVISLAAKRAALANVLHTLAIAPAVVLILVLGLRFPAPAHSGTPLRSLLGVLRQPLVWLFGILLFFESGDENCMFVWAGKVTEDVLHPAAGHGALGLVGLSIALGAGRLLAIVSLKRLGGRNLLLLSTVITVAGTGLVLLSRTLPAMIAGFAVIGLGMSAVFPTALGLLGDRFPGQTGTVFGAVMTVALVGGAAGPTAGGWAASSSPSAVLAIPFASASAIAFLTLIISGWKGKPQMGGGR